MLLQIIDQINQTNQEFNIKKSVDQLGWKFPIQIIEYPNEYLRINRTIAAVTAHLLSHQMRSLTRVIHYTNFYQNQIFI